MPLIGGKLDGQDPALVRRHGDVRQFEVLYATATAHAVVLRVGGKGPGTGRQRIPYLRQLGEIGTRVQVEPVHP